MIKGKTSRPVKLAVTTALPAPPGEESALLIEDGNALQGFIGDIDVLLGIEGDGHGPHDLAISGATAAKIAMILFGQRAHGDPFIAHAHLDFRPGPIQDIEHAIPANSHIDGVVKASATQAIKADGMAVAIQILGAHVSYFHCLSGPLSLRLRRQRAPSLTGALPAWERVLSQGEGAAQLRELILPHRDDQLQHVPDARHRRSVIGTKVQIARLWRRAR